MNKEPSIFGEKFADKVVAVIGSWQFIIIQTVLLIVWIIINVLAWTRHWDPYPFILLNLALSFQAAYAVPIILMSQNRAAERDRKKAEIDLATDRKAEREIQEVLNRLKSIEGSHLDPILKKMNDLKIDK